MKNRPDHTWDFPRIRRRSESNPLCQDQIQRQNPLQLIPAV